MKAERSVSERPVDNRRHQLDCLDARREQAWPAQADPDVRCFECRFALPRYGKIADRCAAKAQLIEPGYAGEVPPGAPIGQHLPGNGLPHGPAHNKADEHQQDSRRKDTACPARTRRWRLAGGFAKISVIYLRH
jgi:hypothetical protein